MMCNEQCYSLAVEQLLGITVPERAQYIRGIYKIVVKIYCVCVYASCKHYLQVHKKFGILN